MANSFSPLSLAFAQNIVVCVEEWVDPLTLVAYEGAAGAASKQKEVRKDDNGNDAIRIGGGHNNNNNNNNADLKAELRQAEEDPLLPGIIQDIVDVLSVFRDPGSNHFLRYITNEDIGKEFREGRKQIKKILAKFLVPRLSFLETNFPEG